VDSGKATEGNAVDSLMREKCAIAAAIEADRRTASKYVPPLTVAALCSSGSRPGPGCQVGIVDIDGVGRHPGELFFMNSAHSSTGFAYNH
jgi:hypothetical protein